MTHSIVTELTFFLDEGDTNSFHGKSFCSPLGTLKKIYTYVYIKYSNFEVISITVTELWK
jgi:hypothetical protein